MRPSIVATSLTRIQVGAIISAEKDLASQVLMLDIDNGALMDQKLWKLEEFQFKVFRPFGEPINGRPAWTASPTTISPTLLAQLMPQELTQKFSNMPEIDLGRMFPKLFSSFSCLFHFSGAWCLSLKTEGESIDHLPLLMVLPGANFSNPYMLGSRTMFASAKVKEWTQPKWRTTSAQLLPGIQMRVATEAEKAQDAEWREKVAREATPPAIEPTRATATPANVVFQAIPVARSVHSINATSESAPQLEPEPATAAMDVEQPPPPPTAVQSVVDALDESQEVLSSASQVRPESEVLAQLAAAEAQSAQARDYKKAAQLFQQSTLLRDLRRQIEAKERDEDATQARPGIRTKTHRQRLNGMMTAAIEEAKRLLLDIVLC